MEVGPSIMNYELWQLQLSHLMGISEAEEPSFISWRAGAGRNLETMESVGAPFLLQDREKVGNMWGKFNIFPT